jgi:ubiquinone/menaquinone biosynthesis C-methylase UbiE
MKMFEKDNNLSINTVIPEEQSTIEEAKHYEEKRFSKRYRMRRLDKFENVFAHRLFDMAGGNSHILDIPCGSGRFFNVFSKAGKLTMADYSVNMLKVCEEKFGIPENARLIQADISTIPLPDSSADLCFCMRLFHHMKNDQVRLNALKELARVSSKYVALSFYNINCLRFYRRKILGKKVRGNYIAFKHLANLAKQAGLKSVERFPKLNLVEQQCLVIFKKV